MWQDCCVLKNVVISEDRNKKYSLHNGIMLYFFYMHLKVFPDYQNIPEQMKIYEDYRSKHKTLNMYSAQIKVHLEHWLFKLYLAVLYNRQQSAKISAI